MKKEKVVIISSGYYDPIHRGHIEYLQMSKKLHPNSHHVAIVNNDNQLKLKKGNPFMNMEDRAAIIRALGAVDEVFESVDQDRSVCQSIKTLAEKYKGYKIVFSKGGDRNVGNIPEREICDLYGIDIVDGVGEKIQSSSSIISEAVKKFGEKYEKMGPDNKN